MTDFNHPPSNATPISTLPHEDTLSDGERLLAIKTDGSLKQLLAASLLAPKGEKGDTGPPGSNGKDATTPALTIFPYYDTIPPNGYLLLCGQNFDHSQYPLLANIFQTGTLPDFRDRVLRGAGDFIQFGEIQEDALQNITGSCWMDGDATGYVAPAPNGGAFYTVNGTGHKLFQTYQGNTSGQNQMTFDASRVARTAAETRVKSIGINFIIKAE